MPNNSFQIPFRSLAHRTTESNTLQAYVTSVMDSERDYLELGLLYMESLNKPYCTTTESNTLQAYVTSVMDSERDYLELVCYILLKKSFAPLVLFSQFSQNFANCYII